jgi:hypothetical protein
MQAVSINEFLKPAGGDRYYNPGRGRGRGRGRGGYGGNTRDVEAPSIEDPGQFPTLGGKWYLHCLSSSHRFLCGIPCDLILDFSCGIPCDLIQEFESRVINGNYDFLCQKPSQTSSLLGVNFRFIPVIPSQLSSCMHDQLFFGLN